jgi:uncharacterized membrane protein YdjX (TVP38/TMEM64 family)
VEAAVAKDGWKMVLLLRISPIVPFTPLNYIIGIMSISFWAFFWASAIGLIPGAPCLPLPSIVAML